MKKLNILVVLSLVTSMEIKTQTEAPYTYDPKSGNYVITSGQDTLIFFPQTKIVPSIRSWTVLDNNTFEYSYEVTNGNLSALHLSEFYLPNSSIVTNIRKPNNDWNFGYHKVIEKLHWSCDKLNHYASPEGDYYEIGMPPNSTTDGFGYRSKGLPTVIHCYFQGSTLNGSDHELAGDIVRTLFILGGFPLNYVEKTTIGPFLPPEPFGATAWCDTLLSYTRQSVTLGWLKSTRDDDSDDEEHPEDGLSKNIEKRIEKARKELIQGDSAKARKELEKLVKKVEKIYKESGELEKKKRESEIVMTSEAYALLKYNAEYLIDRLPKEKGGKDHGDKDHQ